VPDSAQSRAFRHTTRTSATVRLCRDELAGGTRVAAMVLATVRFWLDDEGWGVLDPPETPGG
jgi:hypothetical protein